jgi:hypothetical protein
MGDNGKLAVNSTVGMFKPRERENWHSLHIVEFLCLLNLVFISTLNSLEHFLHILNLSVSSLLCDFEAQALEQ